MHVLDNRMQIVFRKILRRHSRIADAGLTIADHRPHQVSAVIPQNELRTQQVWTAEIAATEIHPVARATADAVDGTSTRDDLRVPRLTLQGRIGPLGPLLLSRLHWRWLRDQQCGQPHQGSDIPRHGDNLESYKSSVPRVSASTAR